MYIFVVLPSVWGMAEITVCKRNVIYITIEGKQRNQTIDTNKVWEKPFWEPLEHWESDTHL